MIRRPPRSTLFPTRRSSDLELDKEAQACHTRAVQLAKTVDAQAWDGAWYCRGYFDDGTPFGARENAEARIDSLPQRSEEHTSELQSQSNLVCRLLLEKKNRQ